MWDVQKIAAVGEEEQWDITFMFVDAGCAEDDKAFGAGTKGQLKCCFEEDARCICAECGVLPRGFEPR